MTKSVKWVGCWITRKRLGRALEAADQVHHRAHDQELGRQVLAEGVPAPDHGAEEVHAATVHTGTISSIEVMIASVSAQSAIGL